jgi:hypothetical protein
VFLSNNGLAGKLILEASYVVAVQQNVSEKREQQ